MEEARGLLVDASRHMQVAGAADAQEDMRELRRVGGYSAGDLKKAIDALGECEAEIEHQTRKAEDRPRGLHDPTARDVDELKLMTIATRDRVNTIVTELQARRRG